MAVRVPNTYPPRVDPAEMMSDAVFKSHFRFDKQSVVRLVDELGLHRENNRGLPINPQQALCICLCHLAGGHYQRISALCIGNVSKSTAHYAIKDVRSRILQLKSTYMKMPTRQEREETAAYVLEKYKLPGFAYGICRWYACQVRTTSSRHSSWGRLSCCPVLLDAEGLSGNSSSYTWQ